jgi:hypothetical protein
MPSPAPRPTRELPAGYRPAGSIDLAANVPAQVGLSLGGIVLFIAWYAGFSRLIGVLRPAVRDVSVTFGLGGILFGLVAALAVIALVLILHEAAHGLCFWLFTRDRPRYGFKGAYAYAAAPDWHFPHREYAITAVAPLVLLIAGGLALVLIISLGALPILIFALSFTAAGAFGDLRILVWIALSPRGALFRDRADAVTHFVPTEAA